MNNKDKFNIANQKIEALGFMLSCSYKSRVVIDASRPVYENRCVCNINIDELSAKDDYEILDKLPILKAYILNKNINQKEVYYA